MMRFKGKVDGWFHAIAIAVAVILLPIIYLAFRDRSVIALLISLAVFLAVEALCVSVELNNYVELRGDALYIAFGLVRREIPYAEISALAPSRSSAASLAASMDRIEIRRKDKPGILIAVSGKHRFFREISRRAPHIVLL